MPFIREHENARKQRETPEFIMETVRRRGYFEVSWRWRDEWLDKRCRKLRKQGLLRIDHERSGRGSTVWIAGPALDAKEDTTT